MPEDTWDLFAKELRRYSSLLVREDIAVEQLAQSELTAKQVLDPTLLLGGDDWRRIAEPIHDNRFVLVYQIHRDSRVGRYAEEVAKHKGLPLIRLSASLRQCVRPGSFRWAPTLGQFISYIDGAACVITDSFHGTAFSLNLNTPFVEVLPVNGTAGRNVSILRLTGLQSRVLGDEGDVALGDEPIDWNAVNQIISGERQESLKALKGALGEECK